MEDRQEGERFQAAGTHVSLRGQRGGTYGAGFGGAASRCCCPHRPMSGSLQVAKDSVSATVVGGKARAAELAVAEGLLVGLVGVVIGAPAVVVLDDCECKAEVGAVVETPAVALPITVDCGQGVSINPTLGSEQEPKVNSRGSMLAVLTVAQYSVGIEGSAIAMP